MNLPEENIEEKEMDFYREFKQLYYLIKEKPFINNITVELFRLKNLISEYKILSNSDTDENIKKRNDIEEQINLLINNCQNKLKKYFEKNYINYLQKDEIKIESSIYRFPKLDNFLENKNTKINEILFNNREDLKKKIEDILDNLAKELNKWLLVRNLNKEINTGISKNSYLYKIPKNIAFTMDRYIDYLKILTNSENSENKFLKNLLESKSFILTGQALTNCILEELGLIKYSHINDIDIFVALKTYNASSYTLNESGGSLKKESDLLEYNFNIDNKQYAIYHNEKYDLRNDRIVNYIGVIDDQISTYDFGQITTQMNIDRDLLYAKKIINGFDLNLVKVGLVFDENANKYSFIITDEFLDFIIDKQIKISKTSDITSPIRATIKYRDLIKASTTLQDDEDDSIYYEVNFYLNLKEILLYLIFQYEYYQAFKNTSVLNTYNSISKIKNQLRNIIDFTCNKNDKEIIEMIYKILNNPVYIPSVNKFSWDKNIINDAKKIIDFKPPLLMDNLLHLTLNDTVKKFESKIKSKMEFFYVTRKSSENYYEFIGQVTHLNGTLQTISHINLLKTLRAEVNRYFISDKKFKLKLSIIEKLKNKLEVDSNYIEFFVKSNLLRYPFLLNKNDNELEMIFGLILEHREIMEIYNAITVLDKHPFDIILEIYSNILNNLDEFIITVLDNKNERRILKKLKKEIILSLPQIIKEKYFLYFFDLNELNNQIFKELENNYKNQNNLILSDLETFEFKDNGIIFEELNTQLDLTIEGNTMNHCVGGYANSIAKKKSVIIRIDGTDIHRSFRYTMEYDPINEKIVQIRGKSNCAPKPEHKIMFQNGIERIKKIIEQRKKDGYYEAIESNDMDFEFDYNYQIAF